MKKEITSHEGKKDRRKPNQRVIWVAEPNFANKRDVRDRRIDQDVQTVALQILNQIRKRQVGGIIFSTISRNGTIEYGCVGVPYDSPVLASGMAARLQAMLDAWETHPGDYLPDLL